jgi:hypothetical protein
LDLERVNVAHAIAARERVHPVPTMHRDDMSYEDRLNVYNALMRRVIAALIPLYRRDALTAPERDAVYAARDVLDALLARR